MTLRTMRRCLREVLFTGLVVAGATRCSPPESPEEQASVGDAGATMERDAGPDPREPETDPRAVGPDGVAPPSDATETNDDVGPVTAVDSGVEADVSTDTGAVEPRDTGVVVATDRGAPMDTGPLVPERRCVFRSTTYASGTMQELDVGPTSTERLRFTLENLPLGATAATLRYDSHDADHPGQEGFISVNGMGRVEMPANPAWDNVTVPDQSVSVMPSWLRAGSNTVEFGPSALPRSFFRVGRVALEFTLRVAQCPGTAAPMDGGMITTPDGGRTVERTMRYDQAVYTLRRNWVFRCTANYAYTAQGDHIEKDCGRLYNPDGTLRGTATFRFTGVIAGAYDILVTSRHSTNRNLNRALFVVNGEPGRINQRDDLGGLNLWTDLWGRRTLAGEVTVVLDATNNRGSDSVSSVTLRPAR